MEMGGKIRAIVAAVTLLILTPIVSVAPASGAAPRIIARNGVVRVTGTAGPDVITIAQLIDWEVGLTSTYRVSVNDEETQAVLGRSLTINALGGDDEIRFGSDYAEVAERSEPGPIGRVFVNMGAGNDALTTPSYDLPVDVSGDFVINGGPGDDSAMFGTRAYDYDFPGPLIGRNLVFIGGSGVNSLELTYAAGAANRVTATASGRGEMNVRSRYSWLNELVVRGGTVDVDLVHSSIETLAQVTGGRGADRFKLTEPFPGDDALIRFDGGAGADFFLLQENGDPGFPSHDRQPGEASYLVRLGPGDDRALMAKPLFLNDLFDGGAGTDEFSSYAESEARVNRFEEIGP
jgi:hypothetical protein